MTQKIKITKERIHTLEFKASIQVQQHPDINNQLNKALMLGNTHKRKVNIIFQDDESIKTMNTTIWAYGTKYVCFKGGVWIPKSRLIEIEF
jgi:ssRNA-specific RNase YbeY (16S rRNA maturation enzyme)